MRKHVSLILILVLFLAACSSEITATDFNDLEIAYSMELAYAKEFRVDYLTDGCSLISIHGNDRFLVVPEGQDVPQNVDSDITILEQPIDNIYLAATSAMCL
ncbi:MAG: ABC transporter substrate-binding protein, partial [Clostridiaceae bacterium]|nr:ABC transporter substrate-binding protein [Clostridiaceae bacterium]